MTCAICEKPLNASTGKQPDKDTTACDDCYFEKLGEVVENQLAILSKRPRKKPSGFM